MLYYSYNHVNTTTVSDQSNRCHAAMTVDGENLTFTSKMNLIHSSELHNLWLLAAKYIKIAEHSNNNRIVNLISLSTIYKLQYKATATD